MSYPVRIRFVLYVWGVACDDSV